MTKEDFVDYINTALKGGNPKRAPYKASKAKEGSPTKEGWYIIFTDNYELSQAHYNNQTRELLVLGYKSLPGKCLFYIPYQTK